MRIGELAEAVGVSTRTVRHYHRVGVLPEPPRTPSGYRSYGLRDLVRLSRARRLVELGLALEEVRGVLADEEGRELGELIEEMDVELALQQERLAAQRRRLAGLRAKVRDGRLDVTALPHADLVDFFARVEAAGGTGPIARLDRDVLSFVPDHEARRWVAPILARMHDEGYTRRVVAIYDDFDRLAGTTPDDPMVEDLVTRVLGLFPPETLRELAGWSLDDLAGPSVVEAMFAELAPAQAAAARLLLERARAADPTGRTR